MSSRKDPTRREFFPVGSAAALAAAAGAARVPADATPSEAADHPPRKSVAYPPEDLLRAAPQRSYSGENATQVAMPLGGIGAGSICLNGYGGLQDFALATGRGTRAVTGG